MADNFGHRNSLVINIGDVMGWHRVVVQVMVAEVTERNEREAVRTQPEAKTHSNSVPPETKPDSRLKARKRWQRRPTAIITRVPPGYPGRAPNRVGQPAPAEMVV